jgi:3-oxoacyl-[acyl-carrier-protein] synthase-1
MRRVVVTGIGIVSCIGNDAETVTNSLKNLKSGISSAPEYKEFSFRSLVHGKPKINLEANIDRRLLRFMGDGAAFNYIAMKNAIEDSGLEEKDISNEMTGIIMGSGGPSTMNLYKASELGKNSGSKKVGPFMVPRSMSSTNSATLATPFKIKGVNYSITSACSTSSHCIGNGYELIQMGKQNIVFTGGGEELHWTLSILFDAMGALSSKYNDNPTVASRAYDSDRDGFVISGGGGTLVLEELEHAKARGAKIYGEITGYGATSDGFDMVQPSGEGAERCMKMAIKDINGNVDYINSHGTSTPIGDIKELEAIKNIFGDNIPKISSTKSLTGHSLGATGVHEAIYCLLMLNNNFLCGSANINNMDENAKSHNILLETENNDRIENILSNSFGFGGTNATLLMSRYND